MNSFLVVDDSATIRATLSATIKALEPTAVVGEAATHEDAVKYLSEVATDAVFLDMMLTKEGGGVEAAEEIIGKWPLTKVVVLTGLNEEAPEVREVISLGAFAYLQKPIRRQGIQHVFDSFDVEADRLRRIP